MVIKLSVPSTRQFWEIPILYEDDYLLALDKPVGLPSGLDTDDPNRPYLLGLLHKGIADGKAWATAKGISYLMNAHRLDPEVSGVLLLAKSKPVLTKLLDVFGSEQPNLWFVTLVQGTPPEDQFSVEAKLAPHPVQTGLMRVDAKHGKRARSRFEVIERFAGWTLLKGASLTSRPHQIRVHLRRAGLPIAGDEAYGGKPLRLSSLKPGYHLKPKHVERPLIGQACLHAEQLSLRHPVTGQPLVVNAPWPKELLVAVKYLRRYGEAATIQRSAQEKGGVKIRPFANSI
jgi:RluA family pseudouridine synthase